MRRTTAVLAAAGATLLVAITLWALPAAAATRDVDVRDDAFVDSVSSTSTTTITAGDTVLWTWSGSNDHTVDNNGGSETFSSGAPKASGTFSHTFNAAGTYNYICGVHGTAMQGTVIVQAAQQAPTSTNTPPATTTPVPQATNTSSPGATNTMAPDSTATAVTADPVSASVTPAPPTAGGTAAAGAALPATGTGASEDTAPSVWVVALAALAALGAGISATLVARRLSRT